MKRIVVGGLLAGLALLVVGFIFGSLTADLYMMSPGGIFKSPMNFNLLIIYDFVVGLILAYAYSVINTAIPKSGLQKGLVFGLLIWLVGTVPGLGITYITMNVRNKLIFMWAFQGLIAYLLAGAAIQAVDEKVS
jgi:uncharacterized membrane protein YagU involved in acid resistance